MKRLMSVIILSLTAMTTIFAAADENNGEQERRMTLSQHWTEIKQDPAEPILMTSTLAALSFTAIALITGDATYLTYAMYAGFFSVIPSVMMKSKARRLFHDFSRLYVAIVYYLAHLRFKYPDQYDALNDQVNSWFYDVHTDACGQKWCCPKR